MGTGTGDLAIAAAQMYPGARIVGVDFTPEMLERGSEKLERLDLGERVRLQVGDGARLDFPDDAFDACCSAFVARNLADLPGGLAEMRRVVKPGRAHRLPGDQPPAQQAVLWRIPPLLRPARSLC